MIDLSKKGVCSVVLALYLSSVGALVCEVGYALFSSRAHPYSENGTNPPFGIPTLSTKAEYPTVQCGNNYTNPVCARAEGTGNLSSNYLTQARTICVESSKCATIQHKCESILQTPIRDKQIMRNISYLSCQAKCCNYTKCNNKSISLWPSTPQPTHTMKQSTIPSETLLSSNPTKATTTTQTDITTKQIPVSTPQMTSSSESSTGKVIRPSSSSKLTSSASSSSPSRDGPLNPKSTVRIDLASISTSQTEPFSVSSVDKVPNPSSTSSSQNTSLGVGETTTNGSQGLVVMGTIHQFLWITVLTLILYF